MVAVVGTDDSISPTQLLKASKEFYRRSMEKGAVISEMTASATREINRVSIIYEPCHKFAYEALARSIILFLRSVEEKSKGSRALAEILQSGWDRMFMIDIYPENQARFGVNIHNLIRLIEQHLKATDQTPEQTGG